MGEPRTARKGDKLSKKMDSSNGSNVKRRSSPIRKPQKFTEWLLKNQTGLCFNLIGLLFSIHIGIPRFQPYTKRFFTLSHYDPDTGKYATGNGDYYFMAFCIVLLTGLRAAFMDYIAAPLGRCWGLSKPKDVTRFNEQTWMLVYYVVFWSLGMYIYAHSPFFLNMKELWTNWPQREIDGLMKAYFLAQWSFWMQQVLIINIEAPRKDYWEMLSHHFVTISLVCASYYYHHTRIGLLIFVEQDTADLIMPLAKCLKYLGFTTICDATFALFAATWLITRHPIYFIILKSVWADSTTVIDPGCFKGSVDNIEGPFPSPAGYSHLLDPFINPTGTVCFNDNIKYGFLVFLLTLQAMLCFWSYLLIRAIMRVFQGEAADDPRSDVEEGAEDGEEQVHLKDEKNRQPLEEEVGVEAIDLKAWERRHGHENHAESSGIHLREHSHGDILNRIGCEKKID